jgi:hypothetical protein
VNGEEIGSASWTGAGFRLVEITFDASHLSNGANIVTLRSSQTATSQRLDYVEIQAPSATEMVDGGLLVRVGSSGRLTVPGASVAVDATTFAGETLVATRGTYNTGQLIYFSAGAQAIDFDARTAYPRGAETVEKADYVIVSPKAWVADYEALADHHEGRGLDVEIISLEALTDIYGGGIYGPAALVRFTQIIDARYLLLGAGTTYDTRNYEGLNTYTGIPTGWIQVNDGLAASDDLYTNGLSIAIGRFPARRRSEVVPLIAKLVDFQAPNRVTLMSDRDDSQGGVDRFAHMQRALADTVPSILLETTGKSGETVRAQLTASVQAGGRVIAYQGHSGFQELGRNWLDFESTHKVPPSAWLMSTCLVGSYFFNSDNLPTFAREMLNSPNSGAVSIICSTRYGHADDEHRIVERGLELMATGTDWGNILLTLKREMSSQTIQVYTLLGDPALGSLDFSERRSLNLRSPQGGDLLGGPDPIRIEFSLTGDGWWEETLRISWSRDGSPWTPIMDFQASPGVRDYSLDWTPPADGRGYSIRIEVVE